MHDIEPHYHWLHLYNSEEDEYSPFFEQEHSEFEFSQTVYNYLIHPQWDSFGSPTLYLKILFVDYEAESAIIELIGEWNDVIQNDVMVLKRSIIEPMIDKGIQKFVFLGDNLLNFHAAEDAYYEEWYNELEEGWIAFVNFRPHVLEEIKTYKIDYFLNFGGELDAVYWRKLSPQQFLDKVGQIIERRLS